MANKSDTYVQGGDNRNGNPGNGGGSSATAKSKETKATKGAGRSGAAMKAGDEDGYKNPGPDANTGNGSPTRGRERDRTDRFDRVDAVRALEGDPTSEMLPEQYMEAKAVAAFVTHPGTADHDQHEVFVFNAKGAGTKFDILVVQHSKAHHVRKLIHWSQGASAEESFVQLSKLLSEQR